VYSWGHQPELLPHEIGITKPSLPVIMSESHTTLHKASRIYYGIHHPIQYNNKVKDIGYVPSHCVPHLIGNWREQEEHLEDEHDKVQNELSTARVGHGESK
jgi:hypothetical protein